MFLPEWDACHHWARMPSQVVRTPAVDFGSWKLVVWVKRCKQQYPPKQVFRIISLCPLWSMMLDIVRGLWTSSPSSTRACWNLVDLGPKNPPPHRESVFQSGLGHSTLCRYNPRWIEHTSGKYPKSLQHPKWTASFHKPSLSGQVYALGFCLIFLRCYTHVFPNTYRTYGSIPIHTIFWGMNIHKSQLFWCELQGVQGFGHTAIYCYCSLLCDEKLQRPASSIHWISSSGVPLPVSLLWKPPRTRTKAHLLMACVAYVSGLGIVTSGYASKWLIWNSMITLWLTEIWIYLWLPIWKMSFLNGGFSISTLNRYKMI